MITDSVRLPVMHFMYKFPPEAIIAGASTCDDRISIVFANGGYVPGAGPTRPGSPYPVEYIVHRLDACGEEEPLYQALADTLTNEEYTDEMKILRLNILKQKGDAR